MTTTYNVNIVGNLTNNNGVLSGFSDSSSLVNYATFSSNLSSANSWIIFLKFNSGNVTSDFIGDILSSSSPNTLRFLSTTNYRLQLNVNGSEAFSSQFVQANTDYWIEIVYSGSNYKVYASTDSETYSEVISLNLSSRLNSYDALGLGINIGTPGVTNKRPFSIGSIDLNGCKAVADNVTIWEGVTVTPEPSTVVPKIGTVDILKAYLGNQEISKMYLGAELVFGQVEQLIRLIQIPQMTSTTQDGYTVECNRYSEQYAPNWYTVFSPQPSQYFAGSDTRKPDMVGIKFPESKFISTIVIKQSDNSNSIAHNGYITVTTDGTNYSQITTFTMNTTLESTTSIPIGTNCLGYRLYFTDNASPIYPANGVAIEGVSTYEYA